MNTYNGLPDHNPIPDIEWANMPDSIEWEAMGYNKD